MNHNLIQAKYITPPLTTKPRPSLPVWWLIGLFLALVLCAQWFADYAASNTFIKSSFAGIGTAVLLLAWVWYCRRLTTVYLYITLGRLWLSALFIVGGLSIFWSVNMDFAVTKWLLWLCAAISFFLVLNIDLNERNLTLFAWGWIAGGTVIATVGILQYFTSWLAFLPQAAPPSSTFTNRNMAAQSIVLVWPMIFFLLFSPRTKSSLIWLLALCMTLMLVYVFYTKTRSAWLSILLQWFAMGGYVWVNRGNLNQWFHWSRNKTNTMAMMAVLVLVMINFSADGFTPLWHVVTTELTSIGESVGDSKNPRYQIWATTWNMIQDHPWIGSGLGSFFHNISVQGYGTWYVRVFQRAHNDLLELTVELGILGLLLFIGALVVLLQALVRIIRGAHVRQRWFYWLVLVALSGSALNMMFSFPYQTAVPLLLSGCYSGFLIKGSDPYNPAIKTLVLKLNFMQRYLILGVTSVACVLVLVIYTEWIRTYEQIDKIHGHVLNNTFSQAHLASLDNTFYHMEVPTLLRGVGLDLLNRQHYKAAQIVHGEILRYWPNYNVALERYAIGLMQLKQYEQAQNIFKKVIKTAPPGLYTGMIRSIALYEKMGQLDQARATFDTLRQQPEQDLARRPETYQFLHKKSIDWGLYQYTPELYWQYNHHHGYRCDVEGNMASFYLLTKRLGQALFHARKVLQQDSDCLSPWVAKKLSELNTATSIVDQIKHIQWYEENSQQDQAITAFQQLMQHPKRQRLDNPDYHQLLHKKSIDLGLYEYTPELYRQYIHNYGYRCDVENNMVGYYLLHQQTETALPAGRKLLQKNPKCVHPWVLQQLQALDSSL